MKQQTDESITAAAVQDALAERADPVRAEGVARFFKSGPGEYGEGDLFRGIRVPDQRRLVRSIWKMPPGECEKLLQSPWHEDRLTALLCLVRRHERIPAERDDLHALYLRNTHRVNNWDLVDASAEYLVGAHVAPHDLNLLYRLAASESLWERRIAIMATFHFVKRGSYEPTLRLAERLLNDQQDLIQKAVGWMLREVGSRDRDVEEGFLRTHYRRMPRTMLRYAIEKFPEALRQDYLKGRVG